MYKESVQPTCKHSFAVSFSRMAERSVRNSTLVQRTGRARVAWRKKVLALAKEDIEKAFELWWSKQTENYPWVKKCLSEAEAKVGFHEEVKICEELRRKCGKGAMYFPDLHSIVHRKRENIRRNRKTTVT